MVVDPAKLPYPMIREKLSQSYIHTSADAQLSVQPVAASTSRFPPMLPQARLCLLGRGSTKSATERFTWIVRQSPSQDLALSVPGSVRVLLFLPDRRFLWPISETAALQLKVQIPHSLTLVRMSPMSPKLLEESQAPVSRLPESVTSLRHQVVLLRLPQAALLPRRPQHR
jgi:hypothetical protein